MRGARRVALLVALVGAAAVEAALASPAEDSATRAAELARTGRFAEAIPLWRETAAGFGAANQPSDRRAALVQLAQAQQALGQVRDSVATLESALPGPGDEASAADLAAIHGALANAALALGPPEAAEAELARALELAREAKVPALEAALLNNRGNVASARSRWTEAVKDYAASAALAERSGDGALAARAYANQARAALQAQSPPSELRAALEHAAALAANLPDSHDTAFVLISIGRSYARLAHGGGASSGADAVEAQRLLARAQTVSEAIGDERTLSFALGYTGALYEEHGRFEEALRLTRRALFLAQQANAPESLYRWHWQMGRLLRATGQPEAAIAAYREAVGVLAGIRYELAQAYASGEGTFREMVGPVFFELVDLLLASAPQSGAPTQQARLAEARETLEKLKAAELRDYFRDDCVDQLEAKVERLDQISKSAIVIYPVILPDRLELLLTFPDGLRRATVAVSSTELTAEVRLLRSLLEKRTTREYLPHAQRVFDWLIRPFEAQLSRLAIDTLVFVPDGALRTIPMSALHDGKRFLIERYAVATTPGLSLTDPRPLDRKKLEVFSGGLSQGVQGYPTLEHVPEELASIHALFGGTELLDGEFRLPRVEGDLARTDFGIVHVATHAQFSNDPNDSFLLTYDGKLTLNHLGEAVGRTRFRERPIELLALSACETAQGNDRAALGLAGVAVQAGARSALGSLWSVNDEAAARLITHFYTVLKEPAVSKAVALQRAQESLLADVNHRHPFYWSAFLLINNWL